MGRGESCVGSRGSWKFLRGEEMGAAPHIYIYSPHIFTTTSLHVLLGGTSLLPFPSVTLPFQPFLTNKSFPHHLQGVWNVISSAFVPSVLFCLPCSLQGSVFLAPHVVLGAPSCWEWCLPPQTRGSLLPDNCWHLGKS